MDREEIETRLSALPRECAVMLAARAALRALPLLSILFERKDSNAVDVILPAFRGVAVSWVAAQWSTLGWVLRAAYNDALDAVVIDSEVNYYTYADAAAAAADAAFSDVASVATDASHAAVGAYGILSSGGAVSSAVYADLKLLEERRRGGDLARARLWERSGVEDPFRPDWERLKSSLLARNEDWDVWTSWYEDRLNGEQPHRELELARVEEITEEEWEAGPKVVNARLKDIEARFPPPDMRVLLGEPSTDETSDGLADDPPFSQAPAAYKMVWSGDTLKAELAPPDLSGEEADAYFQSLLESVRDLASFAGGRNMAGDRLAHKRAQSLLAALEGGLGSLTPATLGPALDRMAQLTETLGGADGEEQSSLETRHFVAEVYRALGALAALSPIVGAILLRRQLIELGGENERQTILGARRHIVFVFGLDAFAGAIDPSVVEALRFREEELVGLETDIERSSDLDEKVALAALRDKVIEDQLFILNNALAAVLPRISAQDDAAHIAQAEELAGSLRETVRRIRTGAPEAAADGVLHLIERTPAAVVATAIAMLTQVDIAVLGGLLPLVFGGKKRHLDEQLKKGDGE